MRSHDCFPTESGSNGNNGCCCASICVRHRCYYHIETPLLLHECGLGIRVSESENGDNGCCGAVTCVRHRCYYHIETPLLLHECDKGCCGAVTCVPWRRE